MSNSPELRRTIISGPINSRPEGQDGWLATKWKKLRNSQARITQDDQGPIIGAGFPKGFITEGPTGPVVNPAVDLPEGITEKTSENGNGQSGRRKTPELPRRDEFTTNWETSEIKPEHIDGVMQLYRDDPNLKKHISAPEIVPYIPKDWDDVDQVNRFRDAVKEFYFPSTLVKIPEREIRGRKIEAREAYGVIVEGQVGYGRRKVSVEVPVERKSHVVLENGTVVGVISSYTDEPWDFYQDRATNIIWHQHVMIVAKSHRGKGLGLYLQMSALQDALKAGATQVAAWVNQEGSYNVNENMLRRVGFKEDTRQEGQAVFNPIDEKDGVNIRMQRFYANPSRINSAFYEALESWEKKKRGESRHLPNQG